MKHLSQVEDKVIILILMLAITFTLMEIIYNQEQLANYNKFNNQGVVKIIEVVLFRDLQLYLVYLKSMKLI